MSPSKEHGEDSRSQAFSLGELERAVEILNPSGGAVSALLCKEDQNEDCQSYKMSPSSSLLV